MARYKEVFTLYPRKTKSGETVWYYRTYNEDGVRTHGISTGLTSKAAARREVMRLYKEGKLIPIKAMTFSQFTENFWVWDKCRYITRCNSMGRKSVSPDHAKTERGYLENHIRPYFENRKMGSITPKDVEAFVIDLKQKVSIDGKGKKKRLADGTINHILKIVKIVFQEALREGVVHENPAKEVPYLRAKRQERGILTIQEMKLLFDESTIDTVWEGCRVTFALNLFAASTGVRRGEILGLLTKYLHTEYVEIVHAWGVVSGLKDTTKTKEARVVPIPAKTSKWLHTIAPREPDLYLFSLDGGKSPYSDMQILPRFYRALEKIGVDPKERKARGITFHSYRHFFNTLCRTRNITDAKVQAVTGHRTKRMTDHYTHFKLEDYREVADVQESVFS